MLALTRCIAVAALLLVAGCRAPGSSPPDAPAPAPGAWWDGRVFYEVFVRSYADSTTGPLANDGIGDFQGPSSASIT